MPKVKKPSKDGRPRIYKKGSGTETKTIRLRLPLARVISECRTWTLSEAQIKLLAAIIKEECEKMRKQRLDTEKLLGVIQAIASQLSFAWEMQAKEGVPKSHIKLTDGNIEVHRYPSTDNEPLLIAVVDHETGETFLNESLFAKFIKRKAFRPLSQVPYQQPKQEDIQCQSS